MFLVAETSVFLSYKTRVDTAETLERNCEEQAREASTGAEEQAHYWKDHPDHLNPCTTGAPKRNEETLKT